jgi:hypothetical protein
LFITPGNFAPSWHIAQPDVIPAWFIVHTLNWEVLTWQLSQAASVGMWPAIGLVTSFGLMTVLKLLPVSWHMAHPLVMPAWFITPGFRLAGLVWHCVHACVVGMWPAGMATAPLNDAVLVWQVSHAAVVGMWFADLVTSFGLMTVLKLLPVSWHVAQPLLMPAWFITPGLRLAGLVWHTVHTCVVGMWPAGMATAPLNDAVLVWQVAHSPVAGCDAVVGRVTTAGDPTKLSPFS